MKNKVITLIAIAFILLTSVSLACAAKFGRSSISFSNFSNELIFVDRVLADQQVMNIPVGVLSAGGVKTTSMGYIQTMPEAFTIEYTKDTLSGQNLSAQVQVVGATEAIKNVKHAKEVTFHFIYSGDEEFIFKIHFDQGGEKHIHNGILWPDESNPQFLLYKDLVEASYDGDYFLAKQLLDKSAPFYWPDDPVTMSPLEWATRWEHESVFNALMNHLSSDYPSWRYANCIRLAAQDDQLEMLQVLLTEPNAKEISGEKLQDIFYNSFNFSDEISTIETLLNFYKVGVDYRVSDYGHTLLFVAVQSDNAEFVKWLIENGADVNAKLQSGTKPIDMARSEKVKGLLSK